MSKHLKIAAVAGVLGVAFLGAGAAFAQADTPVPPYQGSGRWGMGHGPGGGLMAEYHELMHEAMAEALGISLEEFEAARAEGLTLVDLAEEAGVTPEQLGELMSEVRAEVLEQAVADGVITAEQAAWMLERHAAGFGPGHGHGDCDGGGPVGSGPFHRGRPGS